MPSPTERQVHIDVGLTNVSIAYRNGGYIADQIFPIVGVPKATNYYWIYTKADWMRNEVGIRAPGTRARRAEYTLSKTPYVCVEQALSKGVPDEVQKMADEPLRPMITATEYVTDQLLKAVEIDVLGAVFGTGWSSSATPGTLWSSDASDPLGDIETGVYTVAAAIGREPNVAVIGRGLWRYMRNHPDIVDRIKFGGAPGNPAVATSQAVAQLIGVEKFLIASAIYDTIQEGGTSSLSMIGGNHLFLGYVPATPAVDVPAAGYVFQYMSREVNRYREDQEHQDVVEARMSWDAVITAADAGYLVKSAA
jgi:hypothetical protein